MNLRRELPPKKKRGRPEKQYHITLKGYIYVGLAGTTVDTEVFYDNLEKYAKSICKKGEIPCIVFDNNGGSFTGVTKSEK
jgi:hypothetical protein